MLKGGQGRTAKELSDAVQEIALAIGTATLVLLVVYGIPAIIDGIAWLVNR